MALTLSNIASATEAKTIVPPQVAVSNRVELRGKDSSLERHHPTRASTDHAQPEVAELVWLSRLAVAIAAGTLKRWLVNQHAAIPVAGLARIAGGSAQSKAQATRLERVTGVLVRSLIDKAPSFSD